MLLSWAGQHGAHQVDAAERSCRCQNFAGFKASCIAASNGRRADARHHSLLFRWELSRVTSHRFNLLLQLVGDVDGDLRTETEIGDCFKGQLKVHRYRDRMNRQTFEVLVPFSQSRVKDRGFRDQHGLVMIWRSHRCLVAKADNDLGLISAKLRGQRAAHFKAIEQSPIGERQDLAHGHAENFRCGFRFRDSNGRIIAARCGLAVCQVDDTDSIALTG